LFVVVLFLFSYPYLYRYPTVETSKKKQQKCKSKNNKQLPDIKARPTLPKKQKSKIANKNYIVNIEKIKMQK